MTAKPHVTTRRYYQIGGITIQIDSDLPIKEKTFHPKFKLFEVNGPGKDTIVLNHHFSLPDPSSLVLGEEVYRHPPWAIYRSNNAWTYVSFVEKKGEGVLNALLKTCHKVATNWKSTAEKREIQQDNLLGPIPKQCIYQIAIFNSGYTIGDIFTKENLAFLEADIPPSHFSPAIKFSSLMFWPTGMDAIFMPEGLC